MRIVDNYGVVRICRNNLHSSQNACRRGKSFLNCCNIDAQFNRRACRTDCIIHAEFARNTQIYRIFFTLINHVEIRSARGYFYIFRFKVAAVLKPCLYNLAACLVCNAHSVFVVTVDNALFAHGKQLCLSLIIVFHCFMEIKVILCQICEYSHVKPTAVNSVKLQRMARNLHNHIFRLALCHFGKQLLQFQSVRRGGRGALRYKHLIAYYVLICAYYADSFSGFVKYTF